MTDRELVGHSACEPGGELWAVMACDLAQENAGVVAVMRTRAAANSLTRRLALTHRFGGVWVDHVPPMAHVLRGEVRL